MHKKLFIVVLILIVIFTFCSCWDSLDINEKELTTTVVVDKIGDDYSLFVELAKLSGKSSESEDGKGNNKFTIVQSIGKTYVDARIDLDNTLAKPIFLGTVRILIMTENLAKSGIAEYCYRMRNLNQYRKALNIVTTSDDPKEIFEIQANSCSSTGHTIEAILTSLKKNGRAIDSNLSNILEKLASPHSCFLLPHISIDDNSLKFTGYCVVHDNVQEAIIPLEEIRGIHYILNRKVKCVYVVPFNEHHATVEALLVKKKIIPSYENNRVGFDIKFTFEAVVKYMDINDGLDQDSLKQIENNLKEQLSDNIRLAIYTSQKEIGCDYLELSEIFRMKFPNEYKNMEWHEKYEKADINFTIELVLDDGGEYEYNPDVKWKETNDE